MKSLIIIAHGSKKEGSNNEVREIVNSIQTENTIYDKIEVSFLEFATPTLEQSVKKYIEEKSNDITIYPYFLNSGKHVTYDIPNKIKLLEQKYQDVTFTILPHFGCSESIKKIILSDI